MSSSNQDSDCNLRLRIGVAVVIAALACAAISGTARSAASMAFDAAAGPTIQVEDVSLPSPHPPLSGDV
jgi:hypothetical protein